MWIQTRSGKRFYPLEPLAADIDLFDISWALGMLCRFNGHTSKFYSVAEHVCLMHDYFGNIRNSILAKWALHHDDAEAYIGDMSYPLKHGTPFGTEFAATEEIILEVIAKKFELSMPIPPEVKLLDKRICATESRALMHPDVDFHSEGVYEPLMLELHNWDPQEATFQYLMRAKLYT